MRQHPVGLSPDGRWLLLVLGATTVLRDLTGTDERVVANTDTLDAFWSPDGRWLAVLSAAPDAQTDVSVVDLRSDTRRTVSLADLPGARPVGLRNSGELVVCRHSPQSTIDLWLVDPATNRAGHHVTIDAAPALTDGETLPPRDAADPSNLDVKYQLDGTSVLVHTYRAVGGVGSDRYQPDDLLVIDIGTGTVTKRYPLPDPGSSASVHEIDPKMHVLGEAGQWRDMLTSTHDGVLFVALGPDVTQMSGPISLELLDRATGQLTVVTKISGDMGAIKVRGQS